MMTSELFHDLGPVYYTLMSMDVLLNACHFTSRTTFTFLAVGRAEASCDMTGKTQTGVAQSPGPFGAVLGLLLGALALFLFTAPLDSSCKGNVFTAFEMKEVLQMCYYKTLKLNKFVFFTLLNQMFVPITLSVHPGQIIVHL